MGRGKLVHTLLGLFLALAHAYDAANCTQRTQMCNGIMCQDLCDIGTVPTDPWVDGGMAFIRELQRREPMVLQRDHLCVRACVRARIS